MAPAVFFDKDGTLVKNVPFNVRPELIRLSPHALDAAARLHEAGFRLVVVSNQPGVGLGRFPESALEVVEKRLRALLAQAGVPLAGFYYCPHPPSRDGAGDACACRKPAPGLLLRAAHDLRLDLARSWMIGDILDDVEAGRRAGCRTILVDNGGETEWQLSAIRRPHHVVPDLLDAARIIDAADGLREQFSEQSRVARRAGGRR